MKYLLDTNICIYYFKGQFGLKKKFERIEIDILSYLFELFLDKNINHQGFIHKQFTNLTNQLMLWLLISFLTPPTHKITINLTCF